MHGLPSLVDTGVCVVPVFGEQESVVQAFPSSTLTGVCVGPFTGSQPSLVHRLPSETTSTLGPVHWPGTWQKSLNVQTLLSSQG